MDSRQIQKISVRQPSWIKRVAPLLGDIQISPNEPTAQGGLNPYNSSYRDIGKQFQNIFINRCGLTPRSRVLDIGCGTGRLTAQLNGFIGQGIYCGVDVNVKFIEYCQQHIRNKQFDYTTIDAQHSEYNPNGSQQADTIKLPYPDGYFDLVCAIALFNHFHIQWIEHYIAEASRLLTKNGVFFCTIALINTQSIQAMSRRKRPPFTFGDRQNDQEWHDFSNRPLMNVAVAEQPIRKAFVVNKLMITEPIRYGEWAGSPTAVTGHDAIIAIKQ